MAQPADDGSAALDIVRDSQNDIAKNLNGVRMKVAAEGRIRFEFIYARSGKKGPFTSTQYNLEADVPANPTASIKASTEEREGRANTGRFLVVGVVDASDPHKHDNTGTGPRSKDKQTRIQQMHPIDRPEKVLRAVIPETEYLTKKQIKIYVLVTPSGGLCNLRVISQQCVFFFPEFWSEVDEDGTIKERARQLSSSYAWAAAKNKVLDPQAKVHVTPATAASTLSKTLSVPYSQNLVNLLQIQLAAYKPSRKRELLGTMLQTLDAALPQLRDKAPSGSNGIAAFYEKDKPLSSEDCELMLAEIKSSHTSFPSLDVELIRRAHSFMVQDGILDRLFPSSLPGYLEVLCLQIRPGNDDGLVRSAVTHAMDCVIAVEKRRSPAANTSTTPANDYREYLVRIKQILEEYDNFICERRVKIRESFGGIEHYASFEEFMTKVSGTVDLTTLQIRFQQGLAIASETFGSQLEDPLVENLRQLVTIINKVLE